MISELHRDPIKFLNRNKFNFVQRTSKIQNSRPFFFYWINYKMLLDESELKLPFSRVKVQYECRIPTTGVKLPKNEKITNQ